MGPIVEAVTHQINDGEWEEFFYDHLLLKYSQLRAAFIRNEIDVQDEEQFLWHVDAFMNGGMTMRDFINWTGSAVYAD